MTSPAVNSPEGIRRTLRQGEKTIHIDVRISHDEAEQLATLLEAQRDGRDVSVVEASKEYSTTEAAKILGMSRVHLTRLINEGKIRAHKVGNHYRVTAREIESQQNMKKLRENPNVQALNDLWDAMGADN